MKTWDILIRNSTISSGSAWDHLNNQGGGSGVETVSFVGNLSASIHTFECGYSIIKNELSSEIAESVLSSDVGNLNLSVSIVSNEITANILDEM